MRDPDQVIDDLIDNHERPHMWHEENDPFNDDEVFDTFCDLENPDYCESCM